MRSEEDSLKQALNKLKSMSELDKLKMVNKYLVQENRNLKQQLEWKQKADFTKWWDRVKDIPLI